MQTRGGCVYFSFEESHHQIIRNMQSIGIDLERWVDNGRLRFSCTRPQLFGLERHLVHAHNIINGFKPAVLAMDPISILVKSGSLPETQSVLTRLIDFLKSSRITVVMTDLPAGGDGEPTEIGVSSLGDTWIKLSNIEKGNERIRNI